MKKMILIALAPLALAVLVAGCSEAPTQQVQDVTTALSAAEEAGAAQYAPEQYAAAKEAVVKLQAEMTAQNDKFSLLRRYGTAEELAATARQAAETARVEAEAARQRAHDAAQAHIDAAAALLETVRPMLATAPRGKGSEADLRAMEADLVGVANTLDAAREAMTTGDFATAEARATAAEQSLGEVKMAIENAQAMQAAKTGR